MATAITLLIVIQHIVSYTIAQGKIVNVVAEMTDPEKENTPFESEWVTPCSKEELLDCFANWEPEVEELLQVC